MEHNSDNEVTNEPRGAMDGADGIDDDTMGGADGIDADTMGSEK